MAAIKLQDWRGDSVAHTEAERCSWYQAPYRFAMAESVADFGKSERVVLELVKAQVFGPVRRAVAIIKQSELALRFGYKRQFVQVGVTGLVKAGVLLPEGQDTYCLVENHLKWKFRDGTSYDNGSRFTGHELSQIASAPEIAAAFKHQSCPNLAEFTITKDEVFDNSLVVKADDSLTTNELSTRQLTSCQRDNSLVVKNPPKTAPPITPIEDRARGFEIKREEKEENTPPTPPPGGAGGGGGEGSVREASGSDFVVGVSEAFLGEDDSAGSEDSPGPRGEEGQNFPPPPPAEFVAVCKAARKIASLVNAGFPKRLHDSWNGDEKGLVQAWWNDSRVPKAVWYDALNEIAGQPSGTIQVRYFVGIVKNPSNWAKHTRASAILGSGSKPFVAKSSQPTLVPPTFAPAPRKNRLGEDQAK